MKINFQLKFLLIIIILVESKATSVCKKYVHQIGVQNTFVEAILFNLTTIQMKTLKMKTLDKQKKTSFVPATNHEHFSQVMIDSAKHCVEIFSEDGNLSLEIKMEFELNNDEFESIVKMELPDDSDGILDMSVKLVLASGTNATNMKELLEFDLQAFMSKEGIAPLMVNSYYLGMVQELSLHENSVVSYPNSWKKMFEDYADSNKYYKSEYEIPLSTTIETYGMLNDLFKNQDRMKFDFNLIDTEERELGLSFQLQLIADKALPDRLVLGLTKDTDFETVIKNYYFGFHGVSLGEETSITNSKDTTFNLNLYLFNLTNTVPSSIEQSVKLKGLENENDEYGTIAYNYLLLKMSTFDLEKEKYKANVANKDLNLASLKKEAMDQINNENNVISKNQIYKVLENIFIMSNPEFFHMEKIALLLKRKHIKDGSYFDVMEISGPKNDPSILEPKGKYRLKLWLDFKNIDTTGITIDDQVIDHLATLNSYTIEITMKDYENEYFNKMGCGHSAMISFKFSTSDYKVLKESSSQLLNMSPQTFIAQSDVIQEESQEVTVKNTVTQLSDEYDVSESQIDNLSEAGDEIPLKDKPIPFKEIDKYNEDKFTLSEHLNGKLEDPKPEQIVSKSNLKIFHNLIILYLMKMVEYHNLDAMSPDTQFLALNVKESNKKIKSHSLTEEILEKNKGSVFSEIVLNSTIDTLRMKDIEIADKEYKSVDRISLCLKMNSEFFYLIFLLPNKTYHDFMPDQIVLEAFVIKNTHPKDLDPSMSKIPYEWDKAEMFDHLQDSDNAKQFIENIDEFKFREDERIIKGQLSKENHTSEFADQKDRPPTIDLIYKSAVHSLCQAKQTEKETGEIQPIDMSGLVRYQLIVEFKKDASTIGFVDRENNNEEMQKTVITVKKNMDEVPTNFEEYFRHTNKEKVTKIYSNEKYMLKLEDPDEEFTEDEVTFKTSRRVRFLDNIEGENEMDVFCNQSVYDFIKEYEFYLDNEIDTKEFYDLNEQGLLLTNEEIKNLITNKYVTFKEAMIKNLEPSWDMVESLISSIALFENPVLVVAPLQERLTLFKNKKAKKNLVSLYDKFFKLEQFTYTKTSIDFLEMVNEFEEGQTYDLALDGLFSAFPKVNSKQPTEIEEILPENIEDRDSLISQYNFFKDREVYQVQIERYDYVDSPNMKYNCGVKVKINLFNIVELLNRIPLLKRKLMI